MEAKSQTSQCRSLQSVYQGIEGKIGRRNAELETVNSDWRQAAMRKLSERNQAQRALLLGMQNALISRKEALERELRRLDDRRREILNDYRLRNCASVTGSIG